uniref:Lipase n=1 Tax=Tetranychus urticae TaxID=32264 RepID=T1JXX3_TETUR
MDLRLCLFCLFCILLFHISTCSDDPDLNRSAVELIESRGFIAQVHTVTTEDNYQLTVHRIVNPLCSKGEPVLLQHGLLSSSVDFLINSPGVGNNLGFVLSSLCYDVWLSNSRGNVYSMDHLHLSSNDENFWKFSFDEMSKYDLPAFINYILKTTGYKKLSYIGFSQGTTQMFGLLSTNTSYSSIIKPFIALAPVTTISYTKSALVRVASDTPMLKDYLRSKGGPFVISDSTFQFIARTFCHSKIDLVCLNIIFLITGYDVREMNQTRLQVYFKHTPAGTSNWAIAHYLQMVKSGRFCKMDFGKEGNLARYGQTFPPDYPIDMIDSQDIALFYGLGDWLADRKDVELLKSRLKVPLKDDYAIPVDNWNHIDFIYAKDLGKYVNTRIVNILNEYWLR